MTLQAMEQETDISDCANVIFARALTETRRDVHRMLNRDLLSMQQLGKLSPCIIRHAIDLP